MSIKPTSKTPLLTELAFGCMNGACNPSGIILSLAKVIEAGELPPFQINLHPAYKVIIGQLSYLTTETLGPTPEAIEKYDQWRSWSEAPDKMTFEQYAAVEAQKKRWHKVGEPTPMIGGQGAITLPVIYESGHNMILAIEPDGYVHS